MGGSRKGRRSVTFTQGDGMASSVNSAKSGRPQSLRSLYSERPEIFKRIMDNIRTMMKEESLDVVQKNALTSLRSTMTDEGEEGEIPEVAEHSLAMFGLASQLSAESMFLGYKPGMLFNTILNLYSKATEEYQSTLTQIDEEPESVSEITKLLAADLATGAKVCSEWLVLLC